MSEMKKSRGLEEELILAKSSTVGGRVLTPPRSELSPRTKESASGSRQVDRRSRGRGRSGTRLAEMDYDDEDLDLCWQEDDESVNDADDSTVTECVEDDTNTDVAGEEGGCDDESSDVVDQDC